MLLSILTVLSFATLATIVILFFFEPNLAYRINKLTTATNHHSFAEILSRITGSRLETFDTATPLIGGHAFYEAELTAIAEATRSIHLEAFIFHDGKITQRFLQALTERARAGVCVRLTIDAIGSFFTKESLFISFREAGGQVAWYQPVRWYNVKRLNNRTHRELLVIDGAVAFVGGAGIADHWLGGDTNETEWLDMMCRVTGPIVTSFETTFAENWLESTGEILTDFFLQGSQADTDTSSRTGLVVTSTPSAARSTRSRVLFQLLIAAAKTSIEINSPYFLPDKSARKEIIKAAQERGVQISIIVPGPLSNHSTVRRVSRTYYGELISAGVAVYEYEPSMIHTKCMVVDNDWSVLGSTNFDSRSFGLNDEVNFVAKDRKLAGILQQEFESVRTKSIRISIEDWKRRAPPERYRAFIDRLLERQE